MQLEFDRIIVVTANAIKASPNQQNLNYINTEGSTKSCTANILRKIIIREYDGEATEFFRCSTHRGKNRCALLCSQFGHPFSEHTPETSLAN